MSATPEREQTEALAALIQDFLDRNVNFGHARASDALDSLAAAVSRLEAERDARSEELAEYTTPLEYACGYEDGKRAAEAQVTALVERERELTRARDAQEKVLAACARLLGDSMPEWAPLPVREIGCEACGAAEARADAAEERERELTEQLDAAEVHRDEAMERERNLTRAFAASEARERELTRALEAAEHEAGRILFCGVDEAAADIARSIQVALREALAGGVSAAGRPPEQETVCFGWCNETNCSCVGEKPPTEAQYRAAKEPRGGTAAVAEAGEKLVRDCYDYLPHRVASEGERYGLLAAKFDEEVAEVKSAHIGSQEFIDELGDLVDVCYALGGERAVNRARLAKNAERGGFDRLLVMRLADITDKPALVARAEVGE